MPQNQAYTDIFVDREEIELSADYPVVRGIQYSRFLDGASTVSSDLGGFSRRGFFSRRFSIGWFYYPPSVSLNTTSTG